MPLGTEILTKTESISTVITLSVHPLPEYHFTGLLSHLKNGLGEVKNSLVMQCLR